MFAPMVLPQTTVSLSVSTHTAHAAHLTTNVIVEVVFLMTWSVTTDMTVLLARMKKIVLPQDMNIKKQIPNIAFSILKNLASVMRILRQYHVDPLHSVITGYQFASMIQLMT